MSADGFNKSALAQHLQDVHEQTGGILSGEEEIALAKRIEAGDMRARDEFITANLRLVISIAKRYMNRGISFEDVIQDGYIGLLKGIDKFDWRKGYKFSTYGTWWIKQSINRSLNSKPGALRVPIHMFDDLNAYRVAYEVAESRVKRQPTDAEVSQESGLPLGRVAQIREVADARYFSLDLEVGDGGMTVADLMTDPNESADEEARVEFKLDILRLFGELLNENESLVLSLRTGLFDGIPLKQIEVAKRLNLTRARCGQIESKALEKLKQSPEAMQLFQAYHLNS